MAGDTNGADDVFVHDRQTGQTTRVSVASDGSQGMREQLSAALSADGRYVVVHSSAVESGGGRHQRHDDVFVHDRQTGADEAGQRGERRRAGERATATIRR